MKKGKEVQNELELWGNRDFHWHDESFASTQAKPERTMFPQKGKNELGLWNNIIWDGCDPSFASALEQFRRTLFPQDEHTSYSLSCRKFSVKSLIKIHLDEPYRRFLLEHYPNDSCKEFISTRLSDYLTPEDPLPHLNHYENVLQTLTSWENRLRKFYRSNESCMEKPESPKSMAATLDSIGTLLVCLKSLKPRSTQVITGKLETKTTTKVRPINSDEFCILCWRFTMRTERCKNNGYDDRGQSTKYCNIHNRSDPATQSNYNRDRRTYDLFQYELDNFRHPELTKFCIAPRFLLTESQQYDYQIIRKVTYELSRSRLDGEEMRKTLQLKSQGLTVGQIAKKMNVKHQTVSKRIKTIERELRKISENASYSSDTGKIIGLWAE